MSLITITSSFGSGGEIIAKEVAEKLGIEYYDDKKIVEYALSMGFSGDDLEKYDEKAPRLLDRLFSNKPAKYLEILGAVVYSLASKGEGVIVGHGAQVFLKDFSCSLHILILESVENRSKKFAREHQVSEDTALQMIHNMDKRLNQFVQYAFNRDWREPCGYDMVFNLDKLGSDLAKNLIVEFAMSDEVKSCSSMTTNKMELLSLKHRVDAEIIESDLNVSMKNILVEVKEKGVVNISGWIISEEEKEKLFSTVKKVDGVKEIESSLYIMPPFDD